MYVYGVVPYGAVSFTTVQFRFYSSTATLAVPQSPAPGIAVCVCVCVSVYV